MEPCTLKAIHHPLWVSTSSHSHLLLKSSICLRRLPISRAPSLLSRTFSNPASGSIYSSNLPPRATSSEETTGGPSWYFDENQDEKQDGAGSLGGVITTDKAFSETLTSVETKIESPVDEQVQPFESTDKKELNETLASVEMKDESPVDEQVQPFESTDQTEFNETLASVEMKDESLVDEQVQPFDSSDKKAFNETLASVEMKDESLVDEQVQPFDSTDKKAFNETLASEETKDKSPVDEQVQLLDFLDNLNIKFGTDDTTSILLYGGGAIAALWLTSTVVGAIDSILLFPKFLEVVGLGYTIWFTSRYLLFKENRDELAAKVEELKEQVLGSDEDE